MRAPNHFFVPVFVLAGAVLAGCATGQGPGGFTTASLPSAPYQTAAPMPAAPVYAAQSARPPEGLGVASAEGPRAPRYPNYHWNGNAQRAHSGAAWQPNANIAQQNYPPVARPQQPSQTAGAMTWKSSPRMAVNQAPVLASESTPRQTGSFIVKPGDTLFGIARQTRTTPEALMAANGLTTSSIQPGQSLLVPLMNTGTAR